VESWGGECCKFGRRYPFSNNRALCLCEIFSDGFSGALQRGPRPRSQTLTLKKGPAEGASSSFPNPDLKELAFGLGWRVVRGGAWLLAWVPGTFWALGAWALQQREEAASDSGFVVCRALPSGAGAGSGEG